MNEGKLIKKQLIKNMILYFIIFTLIFTIFGAVIFNTLKSYIYKSSDVELENALKYIEKYNVLKSINSRVPDNLISEKIKKENVMVNPRIIYILRDENGDIKNEESIGRFYDEYIPYIKFQKSDLNNIYELQVNGYYYRGINYKIESEDGKKEYAQLLINVDAESNIINNYFHTLSLGIVVTILLSLVASYALSRRTLKPIIDSWKKQTEFVQNASHELRTPLTIIHAKQELLLQEPNCKIIDKSEDITLTLNEVKRLTKLTRDLMTLANADSKEIIINKESVKVDELIKEIATPYIEFAELESKTITLHLNYQRDLKIDRNRIHQLLIILLDNAIKYTEKGDNIEINTYLKDNKFVLEVSDTGIGISDKAINHIFDRFYREDKARSREKGGTGLRTINSTHNSKHARRQYKNNAKRTKRNKNNNKNLKK